MWSWVNNAELDRLRKIEKKYEQLQSMMASGMQIKLDCPGPGYIKKILIELTKALSRPNMLSIIMDYKVWAMVKRTRIRMTIPECATLFAKPDFKISSYKKLFGILWKLEAFTYLNQHEEGKGWLGLFLYAFPQSTFTWRPYSIEINNCFNVINKLCQNDRIKSYDFNFSNEQSDDVSRGWGWQQFLDLKVLLDPANGFLTPNGSILVETEFMIKSITLGHNPENDKKGLERLHKIEQKFEWLRSLVDSGMEIKMLRNPSEPTKSLRIGMTIPDFAKLASKPKFHIFSTPINVLCFEWKMSAAKIATQEYKEWLRLGLHVNPPASFTRPYSFKVESCLRISNKSLPNDDVVLFDNIYKTWRDFETAKFEDLLDPEKGFFIKEDGSIRAEVKFSIISATLDHMLDENVCVPEPSSSQYSCRLM